MNGPSATLAAKVWYSRSFRLAPFSFHFCVGVSPFCFLSATSLAIRSVADPMYTHIASFMEG